MFTDLQPAPPDAILGLTEAYKADPNPEKINLGVGVYQDENGKTPVLDTVRNAQFRIAETEVSKSYVSPNSGTPVYTESVQRLLFGDHSEVIENRRAVTAHTPGGTGALRVGGDFLKTRFPKSRIWLSSPTWANHPAIFSAAGMEQKEYPYFDHKTMGLDGDAMLGALAKVPANDIVLLHACCHNPSGMDPSLDQWKAIADVAAQAGWIPFFDFAYQGFGHGLEEDAAGMREFLRPGMEVIIASSYSKNFGLYNERVGGLTIVAENSHAAQAVLSHIKTVIRSNYSNPPAHGAALVSTILNDPQLRTQWELEVKQMRDRINGMRRLLADTLRAKGANRDFSFIVTQNGMFSFTGLNKDQVQVLRDKYSIYIVGSGRINVAGITPDNVERFCEAVVSVL